MENRARDWRARGCVAVMAVSVYTLLDLSPGANSGLAGAGIPV